ncbi:unnamed protein product [Psylliodes chrysocephalus]|uniref:Uncharacterized protein n=1 Tax=Psylliodes chrysocephalus TaxID=3402493 RepID=A0A9P0CZ50_9CUCU|nr:unnamed protein product [Psylliodes chrysocephala]
MLKVHLEKNKILTLQAEEDADKLIVIVAISIFSSYEVVKIVGEDIDLLVLLCGLSRDGGDYVFPSNRPNNNILFVKCGRGKNPDVTYLTNSFTQLSQPRNSTRNIESQNLSDLRFQLCTRVAVKPNINLARLPPTRDAARFHSLQTYHQVEKWLGNENNPLDWGWMLSTQGLVPQ